MKIKDLAPNPENPRTISDERLRALRDSVELYGDLSGIVYNRRSKRLVTFHQRQKVSPEDSTIKITQTYPEPTPARTVAEGHVTINGERYKYREVDADETWERGAMLAANKHGGEWDNAKLRQIFQSTPSLNIPVTGFTVPELKKLDIEVKPYVPPAPEKPKAETPDERGLEHSGGTDGEGNRGSDPIRNKRAKAGDLWILGKHRLVVGDSTDLTQVKRLMDGRKADMVFTDPPYNLAEKTSCFAENTIIGGKGKQTKSLKESEWDKKFDFNAVTRSLEYLVANDCSIYICHAQFTAHEIWQWLEKFCDYASYCIWAKPNPFPSLAKRNYVLASEIISFGTIGRHTFNYPLTGNASSVWTIAIGEGGLHPTQKPVAVPLHAITHSSYQGALVADLFLGSGTTLIACEKSDRVCYGMEINPDYADVILDRWEKLSGQKAQRVESPS